MKKVFFLIAGGGFQWESMTLANQLNNEYSFVYAVPESSVYPESALFAFMKTSRYLVMPEVSSRADHSLMNVVSNLWRGVNLLWAELKFIRPDVAICLGSSMSIPIALVCRLRRIPFIFIESITRTDELSSTGKLLLYLRLVNHFYVQWPDQAKSHRIVSYRGTVL